MMTCQARCLVWTPRASLSGTFGVADCVKGIGHPDPHTSDGITEYISAEGERVNGHPTRVTWQHTDRRTFFGPIEECRDNDLCVLPDGHGRNHAY